MSLNWSELEFQYLPTNGYVQANYAAGRWSGLEVRTEPYLSMHIAANCLHYGQACFEGLKAFRTRDNTIVIFRPDENARRLALSADRLCMACPSEALFNEACITAVKINREFVPPYGSGASLYIRPVLIGTEPTIGIKPSSTYAFIVLVTPVGPYYKKGFKPVDAVIIDEYDRAAPLGTGRAKMGGNYAASLKPDALAHAKGFPIVLYTDAREHKYVEEFGTSNFIGITPAGEYKTPDSTSILQSITNKSLQVLAADMGLDVKREQIPVLALVQFSEAGSCGTASVITPVHAVHYRDQVFRFGRPDVPGEVLTRLYKELQGIQYGDIADRHGWLTEVEEEETVDV
jgi:branched-chain amino acid aminotransferase